MNFNGFKADVDRAEPLADDIIVRQSTIEAMTLCPARVGQSRSEGFLDYPSEAMSFGTLMHRLIELDLTGAANQTTLLVGPFIHEVWRELVAAEGYDLHALAPPALVDAGIQDARRALIEFFEMPYRHLPFESVEETRVAPLGLLPDSRAVWIQGTADGVTADEVVDWKTASRGWDQGKAIVRVQGPLYVWLWADVLSTAATLVHYFVWNRQGRQWEHHPTLVTPNAVESSLHIAWQYGRQIAADAYPATPAGESYGRHGRGWHCSAKYCAAWNICPFKGMVQDDVDLTVQRVAAW